MSGERFGPVLTDSGVTFRLWAPAAKSVDLVTDTAHAMTADDEGWFTVHVPDARAGTRYRFRIDRELVIPDPASRFQPEDVHGPSEVIDHGYDWQCADWKGRPWQDACFLELHVGTFTNAGTFRAAIDKLDHVAAAGITAIELMPVSDFPGRWNWGYDGVLPFAPDSTYGRPEDLKALIDAAHQRGLMVFLDVVYNHFGPEGNYLGRIAPAFFTRAQTPWGSAIDYRVPQVRAFAVENAAAWLRDYRFDGLRLDAVHAIVSRGMPDILIDISRAAGVLAGATGRHIHLVLENDDNAASLLAPDEDPPRGRYRAQWNDDFHHAWHARLTGESAGYYRDYIDSTPRIIRSMAEGFAYQGEPSEHRGGRRRGEPSGHLSPLAFVNFLQNHDQIGNRARGERLTSLVSPADLEVALAILLLSPSPPLLFMGEEWGSTQPFPFFCDFKGELADAVRNGRKAEFAASYANLDNIPDPLAESTVRSAVLDWTAAQSGRGAARLSFVKGLLAARQTHIVPLLPRIVPGRATVHAGNDVLVASWRTDSRIVRLAANFSGTELPGRGIATDRTVWHHRWHDPPRCVWAGLGAA
jgi:malto-oligosyltrehalose trehalohydrolase